MKTNQNIAFWIRIILVLSGSFFMGLHASYASSISGTVFEDTTFAGGIGRTQAGASGTGSVGARVELYDSSGNYLSATTTDSNGDYSFTSLSDPTYTVRVVASTVVPSVGGAGAVPVQTFRTNASSGSASTVKNHVGGEDPTLDEAGNGSSTLAALTTGSATPQSITSVGSLSGDLTGVDFGYNFNLIVNVNDSGYGSLRQFIINANAMTGANSTIFMISDGSVHSGMKAAYTNQLTSGVAIITPTTILPDITDNDTTIDGSTQTSLVGDTNTGTLGTGGTVGTDAVSLATFSKPEIELSISTAITDGINISANDCVLSNIAIHGGSANLVDVNGTGNEVSDCFVGITASSLAAPGTNAGTGDGISMAQANATITRNLIAYNGASAIESLGNNASITYNEIAYNGTQTASTHSVRTNTNSGITVQYNLIRDNKGDGFGTQEDTTTGHTLDNNTFLRNGKGTTDTSFYTAIWVRGTDYTISKNVIQDNFGAGINVYPSATGITITQNSMSGNGDVLDDDSGAAMGQIGIDLRETGNTFKIGTSPYYTINDDGDADTGANNLLNYPVIEDAYIEASNLIVEGWAPAGSTIEFFESDGDASGWGEGETYTGNLVEGGGSDGDATTSSYSGTVNGLSQGAETNANRFKYTVALPGHIAAGDTLTATATDGSGNTSEFGGQATVVQTNSISGTVFEDTTFAGGLGRTQAGASGTGSVGARVELYDASGNYLSATTTDGSGDYSFTGLSTANYTVRVVASTVVPSVGGAGCVPVQTFRTNANADTASTVKNHVGGEDPTLDEAGNGSTTLAALTSGSATPQSISAITSLSGSLAGVDFGYSFNLIVNVNDSGYGSLRQFITNANAMTGANSSIFMISDGSAHTGMKAAYANQLTSGVAVITPSTLLPALTDNDTTIDGSTQTTLVGDTNSGTLGTGGTVGTDAVSLSAFSKPEIELSISTAIVDGLDLDGNDCVLSNIAIHGAGANVIDVNGTGNEVSDCFVGITATSLALPGTNAGAADGIDVGQNNAIITRNLIAYNATDGIRLATDNAAVTYNEIAYNGASTADSFGIKTNVVAGATVQYNLIRDNKGAGVGSVSDSDSGHTVDNNSILRNGKGTTGVSRYVGVRIRGNGHTVSKNIVQDNFGDGIYVRPTSTAVTITQNSISGNGSVLDDDSGPASGLIGINLRETGNVDAAGIAPYYTINDDGDADTGANNLLNYPVIEDAYVNTAGTSLVIEGWAPAGSTIEFFESDGDASGWGQGETYIGNLVEGGGSDGDASTSSYSGTVNGLSQGAETNANRFQYTVALPGHLLAGDTLTATATDGSGNTSEFGGQATVVQLSSIAGTVFEDTTFAGGLGRTQATASGTASVGARVELYDASGNYLSATTTDGSGNYSFSDLAETAYTVRVVASTVVPSVTGSGCVPVQTFRTDASSGSAVDVTDYVGGEDPTLDEAGNGSTTLAALTTGSATPQSVTSVASLSGDLTGVDFGYNFNLIVNVNDSGYGSLRQFITNANAMTGVNSTIFMISDGSAHNGMTAGYADQLTSGVAVITPATGLPSLTDNNTTIDGSTQTTLVGDTNSGTLGTGGTVGTDAVAFSTFSKPEIELSVATAISEGFDINANDCLISNIALHGASVNLIDLNGTGNEVSDCLVGITASSLASPATNAGTGDGIDLRGDNCTVTRNLIAYNGQDAIRCIANSPAATYNEIAYNNTVSSIYYAIKTNGATGATFQYNLIRDNKAAAIGTIIDSDSGHTMDNNSILRNGKGTIGTSNEVGIKARGSGHTISKNIIQDNFGSGIYVRATSTAVTITQNSISGNGAVLDDDGGAASGKIGINLRATGDNNIAGDSPYYTINDDGDADTGANNLLNYPALERAYILSGNLTVSGWAPAGATIELFVADDEATGFGQGETYFGSVVEGGGSDDDATTSSYGSTLNCVDQGAETGANRFEYTLSTPGSVTLGSKITATATDGSGNTSEFSYIVTVGDGIPDFTLLTSSTVRNDPVNGGSNPKAIPGAVVRYTMLLTNTDNEPSDEDTVYVTAPISSNTDLYVNDIGGGGSGPVIFSDGGTSSGLSYLFTALGNATDDLEFSDDGGSTWTYTPTADGDGYDSAVTNIRMSSSGTFNRAECGNNPSCSFSFDVRIQ